MKLKAIVLMSFVFLSSCNETEPLGEFSGKFIFDHANIIKEAGFVIGENESYFEIDSRAGNLKIFRDSLRINPNEFIRGLGLGYFIESFKFIEQDSIKVYVWQNGGIDIRTYPMDMDNVDGEILDAGILGCPVSWEENKQEIRFCMSWLLAIQQQNGNFIPAISYLPCKDTVLMMALEEALLEDSFDPGDTLGLYFIDMIYK